MSTENSNTPTATAGAPDCARSSLAPGSDPVDALALAKAAISHVLNAICDDPRKFYLMGWGTGSYAKLTEAHAALHGLPLEEIRKNFVPDEAPYKRYCERIQEEDRLLTHCHENGIEAPSRE